MIAHARVAGRRVRLSLLRSTTTLASLERHVDRRALRLSSTFMEVALKADP
jgi:hypothetical protein